MKRTWLVGVAGVLALLAAGLYFLQGSHAPQGQPPLVEMDSRALSALQTEFNRTPENVRVILLLSPT